MKKNKIIVLISNLVLISIIVATFVYRDISVIVDKEGTIWHHPFVWSSINWIDVLFYFLFLLLFAGPAILYVCGSWYENISKPMQVVHSVFMLLEVGELYFLFYNNMQYMGILPCYNMSENTVFCIVFFPLVLICLYSCIVFMVRIIMRIVRLFKQRNAA